MPTDRNCCPSRDSPMQETMIDHLPDWIILIVSATWCLVHGTLCLTLRPTREAAIFGAHAASFLLFSLTAAIWTALTSSQFITMIGAVSLHGAYSLSFLELWSLSQGSYSFSILDMIDRCKTPKRIDVVREMAVIGQQKKDGRINALAGNGLIAIVGPDVTLTLKGKLAVAAIRSMYRLAHVRDPG